MSIVVQFAVQIVLPAILLVDLFRTNHARRREWLIEVVWIGAVVVFVFLIARWDEFSYYLRVLLFPAFGLVAYVSFRCLERQKGTTTGVSTTRRYLAYGMKGLLFAAAMFVNVSVLQGYLAPADTVELSYPLRGGVYYVGGGGSSRWINNHNAFPPQDYAMDIVRLNAFGNRARGIRPDSLERYTIYGDRVYSPCSGVVAKAVDGIADLPPPRRDSERLAGNHVMIACKGVEVLLAHLQQESITVVEGAEVEEGDVIGKVGNSGNSSQPHLHIHATRGGESGNWASGEGVGIRFGERFLVRNSLFTGRTGADNES